IRLLRSRCTSGMRKKIEQRQRSTRPKRKRPRKTRPPRKKPKARRSLKPRRVRRSERKSFDQSRCQGSEDRHRRRWPWFASRSRRCGRNARRTAFRFREHENESDRRHVRREAVAAKRNWPRTRRLRFVADLARRWRSLWTARARLF